MLNELLLQVIDYYFIFLLFNFLNRTMTHSEELEL